MKKVILFAVVALISITAMSQTDDAPITYVGSTDYVHWCYVPKELSFHNCTYIGVQNAAFGFVDSIVLYDSDIRRVKTLALPRGSYQYLYYVESLIYNEWHISSGSTEWRESQWEAVSMEGFVEIGMETDKVIVPTQTLFNTDEHFEFLCPHYGEEFIISPDGVHFKTHIVRLEGYDIINEEGEVLETIRCADGESVGFYNPYSHSMETNTHMLLWFDGKLYLRFMTTNSVGENKLRFYRIDRQMQKIEPVASVPFSVRPTVMERGQEIVVELDEGSNAREIEVVNALGQTVKRVPVAAGQREVRINSADMGSGMNFISTRTTEGQGTVKIIVR